MTTQLNAKLAKKVQRLQKKENFLLGLLGVTIAVFILGGALFPVVLSKRVLTYVMIGDGLLMVVLMFAGAFIYIERVQTIKWGK